MNDSILLGVTITINAGLGLVILLRNSRSNINRLFFAFITCVILWSTTNYLADHALSYNLWYTRLTFLFGAGIGLFIFYTGNFITGRAIYGRLVQNWVLGISLLLAYACLTPVLVPSITKTEQGVQLEEGPLLSLASLVGIGVIELGLVAYLRSYQAASPLQRNQIRLLGAGVALYITSALVVNLVLPQVLDNWESSRFGPLFTVLFVAFTALSITKHQLFDIRWALVRSLAYFLSMSVLAGIYAVLLRVVFALFITDTTVDQTQHIFYVLILAVAAGLTFQPLKSFFDTATKRVFYRDAYEVSSVVDEFSAELVGRTSFEQLSSSMCVLHQTIRPTWSRLVIGEQRFVYELGRDWAQDVASDDLTNLPDEVTVIDEAGHSEIARRLRSQGVAVVCKLFNQDQLLGFLIFGGRRNGSIYLERDIELLRICCRNLAVAIDNADKYLRISEFNAELQEEIGKATAALQMSNARLRKADKAKDDFISAASHQLKPQLSVAKGLVAMLRDEGTDTKERNLLIENTERSIDRMARIVSRILERSVDDADLVHLELQDFDLRRVTNEELEMLERDARRKRLSVSFTGNDAPLPVHLDPVKIREVISNLIRNAIEYTPPGGKINISLKEHKDDVLFAVQDSGIGIPPEELPHIGKKFYRATNSDRMRADGTGIGVYVARSFIEAHSGCLNIESTENEGSTFGFRLPRSVT